MKHYRDWGFGEKDQCRVWPGTMAQAVQIEAHGQHTLTCAFEAHIKDVDNWVFGPNPSKYFPEAAWLVNRDTTTLRARPAAG